MVKIVLIIDRNADLDSWQNPLSDILNIQFTTQPKINGDNYVIELLTPCLHNIKQKQIQEICAVKKIVVESQGFTQN